jgi:hypothetical protein
MTAAVIHTNDERDLRRVKQPNITAVIFTPPALPQWMHDVVPAIESGAFSVLRTTLHDVTADEIEAWLEQNVRHDSFAGELRGDIAALVERQRDLFGTSRFVFRILTDTPNHRCGFHVDTVAPAAPVYGLLRVYNGNGTAYVDPENVVSTPAFYSYLSRRERLSRDVANAEKNGNAEVQRNRTEELLRHDEACAFLRHREAVGIAPAGAIVAFKHLDIRLHWSEHAPELAWIHASPMEGAPRLVVNVSSRSDRRR